MKMETMCFCMHSVNIVPHGVGSLRCLSLCIGNARAGDWDKQEVENSTPFLVSEQTGTLIIN